MICAWAKWLQFPLERRFGSGVSSDPAEDLLASVSVILAGTRHGLVPKAALIRALRERGQGESTDELAERLRGLVRDGRLGYAYGCGYYLVGRSGECGAAFPCRLNSRVSRGSGSWALQVHPVK